VSTYDEALSPRQVGEGRFRITSDPAYHLWRDSFVHGGYQLAIATRALAAATGRPSPATLTAHYLDRVVPGELDVIVEVIRAGKHATAVASIEQDGRLRTRLTATFADQASAVGLDHVEVSPPDAPAFDDGDLRHGTTATSYHHFVPSWRQGSSGFLDRAPSGSTEVVARYRRRDGDLIDAAGLALLSDILISPAFEGGLAPFGWIPTLELTSHFHRPEAVHAEVIVRLTMPVATRGYVTEDVDIWSADGKELLLTGRQLALVRT